MLIEKKLSHVIKTDGGKFFKDLPINRIFSKHILSWNFKMELYLSRRTNMEIAWLEINDSNRFL